MAPFDGAVEIALPVGPAALTPEQRDLYFEFYGWVSEWRDSEYDRRGEPLPPDLAAAYELEFLKAAREVIARIDTQSS